MSSPNQRLSGYLRAFGTPARVKGAEYLGIVENDFEQVELGARVKVATNQPQVWFTREDVAAMSLVQNDAVDLYDPFDGTWTTYTAKSIGAPRTDGFVVVGLIEPV